MSLYVQQLYTSSLQNHEDRLIGVYIRRGSKDIMVFLLLLLTHAKNKGFFCYKLFITAESIVVMVVLDLFSSYLLLNTTFIFISTVFGCFQPVVYNPFK